MKLVLLAILGFHFASAKEDMTSEASDLRKFFNQTVNFADANYIKQIEAYQKTHTPESKVPADLKREVWTRDPVAIEKFVGKIAFTCKENESLAVSVHADPDIDNAIVCLDGKGRIIENIMLSSNVQQPPYQVHMRSVVRRDNDGKIIDIRDYNGKDSQHPMLITNLTKEPMVKVMLDPQGGVHSKTEVYEKPPRYSDAWLANNNCGSPAANQQATK